MAIPYRTRRALGRWAVVLLVLLLVLLAVVLCWTLWLGRFVVYTDHGIYFDFDRNSMHISGQPAVPPGEQETVPIHFGDEDEAAAADKELAQFSGYYISSKDLEGDLKGMLEQIRQLPEEMVIMVEMKNIYGEFNYPTVVGNYYNTKVDRDAVEDFVDSLLRSGRYVIASVPAFQDQQYGLNNVDEGLFSTGGAYLYVDDQRCYWLSPSSDKVIGYLAQVANELRIIGFDEVVFDQFLFPQSNAYRFSGNKQEALSNAAATLLDTCQTKTFAVSFASTSEFTLPEGRTRLYLRNVEAVDVADVAQNALVPDNKINLVFLTEYHDTRYDICSVMRPITAMR